MGLFLVDSAEVEDYLAVVPGEGLELVVGGEHDYDVGLVERFLVGGELELFVFFDVGLYYEYVGIVAYLQYFAYDVLGGGFAKVVDVWLEGQAHHGHDWLAAVLELELEHGVLDFLGTP